MTLQHRPLAITPNLQLVSKYPEIATIISEVVNIIQQTNRNVYDDLVNLEKLEEFNETNLPTPGIDYVRKPCVYTSGTNPQKVLVCLITGVSPTVYGWKELPLS